jgi:hypothetical protein
VSPSQAAGGPRPVRRRTSPPIRNHSHAGKDRGGRGGPGWEPQAGRDPPQARPVPASSARHPEPRQTGPESKRGGKPLFPPHTPLFTQDRGGGTPKRRKNAEKSRYCAVFRPFRLGIGGFGAVSSVLSVFGAISPRSACRPVRQDTSLPVAGQSDCRAGGMLAIRSLKSPAGVHSGARGEPWAIGVRRRCPPRLRAGSASPRDRRLIESPTVLSAYPGG